MSKIDELLAQASKEFDAVKAELTQLAEQRSLIDKRMVELNTALARLQGKWAGLQELKNSESGQGSVPVAAPDETKATEPS